MLLSMISELPFDVQGHVLEMYKCGLRARVQKGKERVANEIMDFIHLLCNRDDETCEHLLNWLAHMLQHPTIKPNHAILLVGRESCVKRMLINLISSLVLALLTNQPNRDVFYKFGRFHSTVAHVQLVVITDAESILNRNRSHLKHLISDSVLESHVRQQGPQVIPSYHRVLLETHRSCEPNERRVFAIQCCEECIQRSTPFTSDQYPMAVDALRNVLLARPVPMRL